MRFCYADPPYPGNAGYYPEAEEVDHRALVERLAIEGPDGWALSTSATALAQVLALCPPGVRVCSWHRAVRPTRSERPISAWGALVVWGGRGVRRARAPPPCTSPAPRSPRAAPTAATPAQSSGSSRRSSPPGCLPSSAPDRAISSSTSTRAPARSARRGGATAASPRSPSRPPLPRTARRAWVTASPVGQI